MLLELSGVIGSAIEVEAPSHYLDCYRRWFGPILRVAPTGSPPLASVCVGSVCRQEVASGQQTLLHGAVWGTSVPHSEGTILVSHPAGHHYHVDPQTRTIRVCVARPGDAVIDVMQIIRGLMLSGAARNGWLAVHAAVVRVHGKGIMLIGPKGAGKTSLLTALLRAVVDTAFVTNDKSLLDPSSCTVSALPYAIAGGRGTIGQLGMSPSTRRTGEKSLIWPSDLAGAMHRSIAPGTEINEIWHCRLDLASEMKLEPLLSLEAAGLEALQAFKHTMTPLWLLETLGLAVPGVTVLEDWAEVPVTLASGNPWSARWDSLLQ